MTALLSLTCVAQVVHEPGNYVITWAIFVLGGLGALFFVFRGLKR